MLKLREGKSSLHFIPLTFHGSAHMSSLDSPGVKFPPSFVIKSGLKFRFNVGTNLLLAYFSNGQISLTRYLFETLFQNNIQLLNSRLRGLWISRFFEELLDLYCILRLSDVKPNNFTFPYVLNSCANLVAVKEGESIHSYILKCGLGFNLFISNSLVDMYSKFRSLQSARRVFNDMPDRNLVSWNSMIFGYRLNGFPDIALTLCSLMRSEGMLIDRVGMKIVLPICGQLGAQRVGKSVHAHLITLGFSSDTVLVTAVMDMYAKCGNLDIAERLFEGILCKDVVSWNVMISGYSQIGELETVLKFFGKMHKERLTPTVVTVLIALQACADLAVLLTGQTIHGYIIRLGLSSDVSVEALLINMYSKCGKLNSAYWVFNEISKDNVNSWSAMIHGLGMHGYGRAALMGFFKMLKRGIDPDDICFLVVFSSCGHTGLVNEGCKIFEFMVAQFGIRPKMDHYACMVDLFGRAGFIDEAIRFICQMPTEPDISIWGSLLGACRIHGDFEMGKVFGERLVELDPKTAGYYKLLLNIYAGKECWDGVHKIRSLMTERVMKKTSGHSLIEMNG